MSKTAPGTLFVVATPIGNLEDMSPRAIRVLTEADLIACEDTRQTAKLISHFKIPTPLTSLHEHNELKKTPQLIRRLLQGQKLALVSDAGTPLISDPGHLLVEGCHQAAIPVVPIPGPSAVTAALSASGIPSDQFFFAGFPHSRSGVRKKGFQKLSKVEATIVFFLSPHRLQPTLRELLDVFGDRKTYMVREITKVYETGLRRNLAEVVRETASQEPRGEYVLVIEGASGQSFRHEPQIDIAAYISGLMERRGLTRSEAVRKTAKDLGLPRQQVYRSVSSV